MKANHRFIKPLWVLAILGLPFSSLPAADNPAPRTDPRYPFRTDWANANLPWYQPRPGEFPPYHSDRRIGGELVTADFVHRTGQFRASKDGQLLNFTMPPYGSVIYLGAEADLRDVPLGTDFLFFLNQDSQGQFTRLATMQDQFSIDFGHGFSYRVDEIDLKNGKLQTTRHKVGKETESSKKELLVSPQTRVTRGDKQIALSELAVGDELLFNLTGKFGKQPGRCLDIWVGPDTHKAVIEKQRAKFTAFIKERGLPAWIDKIDGNTITVTLFSGDAGAFKQTFLPDLVIGKQVQVCVANDELRTWNPPVDREHCDLTAIKTTGVGAYGTSGVHLTFTAPNMLEGFRKGRIVRLFPPGWTLKDPPCGEGLMNYGYSGMRSGELGEQIAHEYPAQFPYRTDYGNENLPWYQVQPGVTPPRFSEHNVFGELLKVDSPGQSGQLRVESTGETVNFTLLPQGSAIEVNVNKPSDQGPARFEPAPARARLLNADAELADLPLGMRYRFSMYQDHDGHFTLASLVSDEFSYMSLMVVSYRIEELNLAEGKLHVARQIPQVKNYNGDMIQPPDIGRTELLVTPETRIWKGAGQAALSDLAVGDLLLPNITCDQPGSPSHCTDLYVGEEAQQRAAERQHQKHSTKKH